MLEIVSTVAAGYTVSEYVRQGDLVEATSRPPEQAPKRKQLTITRSFAGAPSEAVAGKIARATTAVSETAPLVIGPRRAGDPVIRELAGFRTLLAGWDGEDAAEPNQDSITQAVLFVHACVPAEGLAERLIATLHADGSAILEMNDEVDASLNFGEVGHIIYSIDGIEPGEVAFDGAIIPELIKTALIRK
ncbi:hypothetical protein FV232_19765 [Methylobacterium sp. WL30]|uniref:hypothetical protein n=1 Tax=unclassified Methylobacterium TaxID=2615210 RepID=UPI0011CA4DD9|nr:MULTISPECIES: hypothetical protein [unclassified Methylobacterium]TXN41416.1 hypothetical protein FV225_02700 [Methylobacterium sp. WL93]TXN49798.1 hypothetical protein FV227_14990 [Methylobacterium sp. WL119]TXN64863.1 hypothetical protein FV232_19765 [Methylobacterium sp. WL30]